MIARRPLTAAALFAALALVGCAPAPDGAGDTDATDYCARMVTNSGGLEDRSFNQSSWEGLEIAAEEFDIDVDAIVSTNETDLAPNVEQAVATGCQLVLTVGWELAEATVAAAEANPGLHFAIVDEMVDADNVKPIVFDTAQAAYLAGYLAAGVSETGVVGTFGGDPQPPVTLFMDGFVDGVARYNAEHGTSVRVLGWNKETQNGLFTGDYENVTLGRTTTEGLLDQNADVILPVAGQVGEGAAAAILERGVGSLIWVDNDGYETLPAEYRPIILTSILKNTQDAVVEIVRSDLAGEFDASPFIGTLENGGVGIAPFHDRTPLVSAELQAELGALTAAIIAGEITVESPSSPG
ncbi:BMP family ABC transporter substrate-binding protein [Salinibacterium sp. SYSU T00001]|uniref:BMP family lipoprotein n=1 Tax=Homoserinimonas sedimenticola TaxID=2986805 RepID=UPI002235AE18|nr:BMP family ABC transporter substrate-binding protein [Salinibacterium sedimenticola]MCW4385110.1 BMP family ABC transporter substrate-binding protein [Salinibacterium sedimenticola]